MSKTTDIAACHAATAPLSPSQVIDAYRGGPGTVIVYDTARRCYRTVAPKDQHATCEPAEVVVCGYGDIERDLVLAWREQAATAAELSDWLHAQALDHLRAWAHPDRRGALPPVVALRRAMCAFGFAINRRSRLAVRYVPGEAAGLVTGDYYVCRAVPTVTVKVSQTAATGAAAGHAQVAVCDLSTEVANWDALLDMRQVGTRAEEVRTAVRRYLGD